MREKLLIVDGSNLLFQMFYGMPARIVGKGGKLIHGTLGFVGALLKIIKIVQPTKAIAIFDGEGCNPRTEISADYKANRPDFSQMAEEETPFSQLPDIYAALDYLTIKRTETSVCEADDLVAAYALQCDVETVISSFDSDFFQLISDRVSVLRYRGERSVICDPAYVRGKFEIEPSQYADYKCLVGDAADNVKGARGIGPKRAADLLGRFGCLEEIVKNIDAVTQKQVREGLICSREQLEKNRRLILLDGRQSLPFPLETLAFSPCEERTGDILRAIGAL